MWQVPGGEMILAQTILLDPARDAQLPFVAKKRARAEMSKKC